MFSRYEAPESDCSSDTDTSDADSTESESSAPSSPKKNLVEEKTRNLSLNHLLCMEVGEPADATEAATNGKSKTRIKEVFQKPCCKKKCKGRLTFKLVFSFCTAFWSLSKAGQDSLSLPRNVSNSHTFLFLATSFS